VVRSTADSSLTVAVGSAGTSAAVSTADSKAVSAGAAASTADSKAVSAGSLATSLVNSEGVVRSTADSSLTVTVSTADSKGTSAGVVANSHASRHKLAGADVILLHEFGLPTGAVGFNGQQAENFIIHTVATTAAMTGLTAVVGKFAFNTADLSPYVCTVAV